MLTHISSFNAFFGHCPGRMSDLVKVNKSLMFAFKVAMTAIENTLLGLYI